MPTRNCKAVNTRVENMWALPAEFGKEQDPSDVFLSIIANRYALVKGTQLIRDELMLSFNDPSYQHEENWATLGEEATECGADLSLPSVLTTCGYTMCGDRICQSQALRRYQAMVRTTCTACPPQPSMFVVLFRARSTARILASFSPRHPHRPPPPTQSPAFA
eukprot:2280606-Rhodomonas_salina.2